MTWCSFGTSPGFLCEVRGAMHGKFHYRNAPYKRRPRWLVPPSAHDVALVKEVATSPRGHSRAPGVCGCGNTFASAGRYRGSERPRVLCGPHGAPDCGGEDRQGPLFLVIAAFRAQGRLGHLSARSGRSGVNLARNWPAEPNQGRNGGGPAGDVGDSSGWSPLRDSNGTRKDGAPPT